MLFNMQNRESTSACKETLSFLNYHWLVAMRKKYNTNHLHFTVVVNKFELP